MAVMRFSQLVAAVIGFVVVIVALLSAANCFVSVFWTNDTDTIVLYCGEMHWITIEWANPAPVWRGELLSPAAVDQKMKDWWIYWSALPTTTDFVIGHDSRFPNEGRHLTIAYWWLALVLLPYPLWVLGGALLRRKREDGTPRRREWTRHDLVKPAILFGLGHLLATVMAFVVMFLDAMSRMVPDDGIDPVPEYVFTMLALPIHSYMRWDWSLVPLGLFNSVIYGVALAWLYRLTVPPLVEQHGRYCRRCGYDLRGLNPQASPRCPECGADRRRRTRIGVTG